MIQYRYEKHCWWSHLFGICEIHKSTREYLTTSLLFVAAILVSFCSLFEGIDALVAELPLDDNDGGDAKANEAADGRGAFFSPGTISARGL
jgi:hypothetical protein